MQPYGDDDGKKAKTFIEKNKTNLALWSGLIVLVFFSYHLFSDGDFSFLLTFGSFVRAFAFGILIYKGLVQKSVAGLSLKTLELYAVVFVFRMSSVLRYQGYLPFDSSGDWLYSFLEFLGLGGVCFMIFLMTAGPLKNTYEKDADRFGNFHVPNDFGAVWVFGPAAILAILVHPGLNNNWLADTCWTIALYTESFAILPQLYMFQKRGGGVVETCISHFVYALAFGSFLHLWFWMFSYHELSDTGGAHVGYMVIFVQIANVIVMGDFLYFYFKSLKEGGPMMLPTQADNV